MEKASVKASEKGDGDNATIEVKDAETLWKVNIEAVYRRKNPPASLDFGFQEVDELNQVHMQHHDARKLLSKVPEFIAKYKACNSVTAA